MNDIPITTTRSAAKSPLPNPATSDENRAPRVLADHEIPVGATVRQGDIYLQRVRAPDGRLRSWRDGHQLAPGSHPGARHVVNGAARLRAYMEPLNARSGPVVFATSRIDVDHPEHATISLPPGVYEVTYQRLYQGDVDGFDDLPAYD